MDRLAKLCEASPHLYLHERFVGDDEFDHWIKAADAVVLPYREIWSSSVIERSQNLGTRVIASDLPQLREQARSDALLVSGLDDLRVAMEKAYTAAPYPEAPPRQGANRAGSDSLAIEPASKSPMFATSSLSLIHI